MPATEQNQKVKPSANMPRAEEIIKTFKRLVGERSNWESYWQSLHDYFYIEAANSNSDYSPGTELNVNYLYDSTTLEASDVFASGFMNYLTPPTSKWFTLKPSDPGLINNKAVGSFLEDVRDEVYNTLNNSNFYDQIFPSYKSSGVYGTSLLLEEDDLEDDIRFYNMPLKQVAIVEDARGRVIEYYIEFEYSAFQAKTRWGIEALSSEMKQELESGAQDKKHQFLLFIGVRHIREIQKTNKENMPIEALWFDIKAKRLIEEGGYHEFPAMTHRFDKRPFVSWGFSPAMKALPFARLLNTIAKTNLRTMMKNTDPPIALPHNAFLRPFKTNPKSLNYYKKSAMDSGKDIFAFANFGDPNVGMTAVEMYTQKVKALMFNDIFLAFEGITKQMNNPEIMERINEKMTMLGPAVGRYLAEVLHPIVIRTVGILWRKGKLPNPPDEMIMSPDYNIDFVGQLAQAQRRSELNTLVTGLTMIGNMAQFTPEVLDKVDPDKVTDEVWSITGAPVQVLRDDAEIAKIRQARAQKLAKEQEMAMLNSGADTASKAGKAEADFAKAKETNK